MTNLKLQEFQRKNLKKMPELKSGMTIRVHQKIKEGEKERIQIFEGLIIKVSGGDGLNKTITVRKMVEGIGVEKIFPIYSPTIAKIEVKKKSKTRRAKLYYMRGRSGKSARLKGKFVSKEQEKIEKEVESSAAELAEQVAKAEAEKAEKEAKEGKTEEVKA
jgi:large subunit ribosomal protein L19